MPRTPCLRRFRRYCDDDLQLPGGLDLHSLRRSYATHLIEDGWDAKFVQDQLGHEHASTTSLYTCVSSDFRIRTLRRALDATISEALVVRRRGELMKRQVDYTWRLAELMAAPACTTAPTSSRALPSVVSNCRDRRCIAWFINAPNGFRYR